MSADAQHKTRTLWLLGMLHAMTHIFNVALLPLYLLHLVAQKPRYGNEIMEILGERTNGQWGLQPGGDLPAVDPG